MSKEIRSHILGHRKVPIEKLDRLRFGNPREMTQKMNQALKRSLKEFGIVDAILVREVGDRYEILDGHHRYDELLEADVQEADIILVDCPDDEKARALVIALGNITADWDLDQLNDYVGKLMDDNVSPTLISTVTGFASMEVEALANAGSEFLKEIDDSLAGYDVTQHNKDKGEEQQGVIEDGHTSVSFKLTPEMNEVVYSGLNHAKKKYKVTETNVALERVLRDFIEETAVQA